jgi:hypothetical protein
MSPGHRFQVALAMLLLLAGAAALPFAVPAQAERRAYAVTAAQLTAELAARFPQRRCMLALACATLADPTVRLVNGDPRIFVSVRASPEIGEQALGEGTIEVAGKPRYEPARGAFFIDEPSVLRADFPGVPKSTVEQAALLSRDFLADYLKRTPVWVLEERDGQQAMAKLLLREVSVKDGRLLLVIGE